MYRKPTRLKQMNRLIMLAFALGGALIVAIIIVAVTAIGTKSNTALDKIQSGLTP